MTTTDETTTNGHADTDAAKRLRLKPVGRVLTGVPDWGSPPEIEVHAGALKPGETEEAPVEFTETIVPASSMVERVEVAGDRPPALPGWLTDRQLAREAAARQARQAKYLAGRGVTQGPKTVGKVGWWTLRGAGKAIGRWVRFASDLDGTRGTG
jgi:hypothetical protein